MLAAARVDPSILSDNLAVLGPDRLIDVRADGYGHGAITLARLAAKTGATGVLVRDAGEAQALRDAGVPGRIIAASDPARRDFPIERDAVYGFSGPARPALRVSARVALVKRLDAGQGVSYGHTFVAPHDAWTALVALGYADGVHRRAGNLAAMRLGGVDRAIVGRVAMNALVLLLDGPDAAPGDEAVLFGDPAADEPSIVDWAARLGEDPGVVAAGFGHLVVGAGS